MIMNKLFEIKTIGKIKRACGPSIFLNFWIILPRQTGFGRVYITHEGAELDDDNDSAFFAFSRARITTGTGMPCPLPWFFMEVWLSGEAAAAVASAFFFFSIP